MITQRQYEKAMNEINQAFKKMEFELDLIRKRLEHLEKKPVPKKNAA